MVYLLALGRFFLALGGLDTGSSFGGLGSSREMTISAIAEPALDAGRVHGGYRGRIHESQYGGASGARTKLALSGSRRRCWPLPRSSSS